MSRTQAAPLSPDTPVLSAQGIRKDYGKRSFFGEASILTAVNDVSLDLMPGRTLGIVGESGCGKSTLSRILVGITPATAGNVLVDGELVSQADRIVRGDRLASIQMVFQSPAGSLDPRMRIDSIVGEPLDISRPDLDRAAKRALVADMIRRVGLDLSHLSRYPHELSGGQQQRVGIARALITNPKVVICDEAVSALDVSVQAQIINLLADIQQETGVSYLFISHDLGVIAAIADEIAVMYMGRIVEQGAARTVLAKPAHPYTSVLLDSSFVPDPRIEKQRLRATVDEPGHGFERPTQGCVFRPRCGIALPQCASVRPELAATHHGDTRVACHNYQANKRP